MPQADHYQVEPLSPGDVSQALPLLQCVCPGTTMAAWERFARDMDLATGIVSENRIMVVRSCTGWLFGMFTYLVLPHLLHGRVMEVDNVAILDLGNRRTLGRLLVDEVDAIARGSGCGGIHFHLSESLGNLIEAVRPDGLKEAAFCGGSSRDDRWICRRL